jgi:arylsulfatase A-like enzyme
LGGWLDAARAEGLLDDALVLVVGDHGARVYGSQTIPAPSYRIPALFLVDDARWKGVRCERLCSQIDLAPTLLALAGIEEPSPFLGSSVLGQPGLGGRAFLQHNRDVGVLTDSALVVLGLQKRVEYYTRTDRESDAFTLVPESRVTPELRELADDATAVFQAAYERYEARAYR